MVISLRETSSISSLNNFYKLVFNFVFDVTSSHNIHVDVDGYLYIVGADDHDIWIYDLTLPSNPNLVGTWDGEYLHDIDVENDIVYGMGIYSSTAYIIDVSDKANPQVITSWQYPGMAHDAAVSEDGNYLITADEIFGPKKVQKKSYACHALNSALDAKESLSRAKFGTGR